MDCRYGKYKHDGQNYAVKFMKKHEIIKLKQVQGWGMRVSVGVVGCFQYIYITSGHIDSI